LEEGVNKKMAKYARVLEINDNKVLVGLLNDNGLCGTGACEGCSCSTKLQTMRINVENPENFESGMDVEMRANHNILADWLVLIVMPVLLVVTTILLSGFMGWNISEKALNITAVAAGFMGFALGAVILRVLRRNETIRLEKISSLN